MSVNKQIDTPLFKIIRIIIIIILLFPCSQNCNKGPFRTSSKPGPDNRELGPGGQRLAASGGDSPDAAELPSLFPDRPHLPPGHASEWEYQ